MYIEYKGFDRSRRETREGLRLEKYLRTILSDSRMQPFAVHIVGKGRR